MLTPNQILEYLSGIESDKVERTISVSNTDKFCEAICAFSNDIGNSKSAGCLFIGAKDDGTLSGLKATDELRRNYPHLAICELLMNVITHRNYESNAPLKYPNTPKPRNQQYYLTDKGLAFLGEQV